MTHNLAQADNVDLRQMPERDMTQSVRAESTTVTIGDLHGNSLKLTWFLVRQNIMQLNPVESNQSAEQVYQRLVEIYQTPADKLTANDIKDFNRILSMADVDPLATVRLIGDELADRGANDYFTLRIIEKLRLCNVSTEIILSNHSAEFLDAYRDKALNNPINNRLGEEQARSLYGLATLVKKGLVSADELESIVERHYKPNLKAISYSVNRESEPPEITLFTHAPAGLETIREAAAQLNIDYQDGTIEQLAHTIDAINEAYYQRNITINDLFKQDMEAPSYQLGKDLLGALSISPETPFLRLAWNRTGRHMMNNEGGSAPEVPVEVPFEHNDYRVKLVHGHTGPGVHVEQDNVSNLDNDMGKGGARDQEFTGDYKALYTTGETNAPQRSLTIPRIENNFYDTMLGPIRADFQRVKGSKTPELDSLVVLAHIRDAIKTYPWNPSGPIGHRTIQYKDNEGHLVKNKLPKNIAKIYDKTSEAKEYPERAVDILQEIAKLANEAAISPKSSFISFKDRAQQTQRMYEVVGENIPVGLRN